MTPTRRDFLKTAAVGAAGAVASAGGSRIFAARQNSRDGTALFMSRIPFELGMASYTFRAFGLDEAVAMTKKLGLKKIALKSMHLPLETPDDEIGKIAAKVRAAGLDLYGGGVIYMTNTDEVVRAFDYARAAGMRMIIGVPNPELIDMAEIKVIQTGIALAIHNHGPGDKLYPTPDSVAERIAYRDRRVGLCLDVGHTARSGIDPADAALRHAARLLDVHIKDVSAATAAGTTVEIGRGVINIPAFLRALVTIGYAGAVSLEYEKDEKDPYPGSAESIEYLRKTLAAL
jgi:sugar phosphate isomerase/epimerase